MSDFRVKGQASVLGKPSTWIDSSESTTHNETVAHDGTLNIELLPQSDQAATVTVTITDSTGREDTRTVTPTSHEAILIPSRSKVRVTYTAGQESRAKVVWTPMGAS
ncbi:hypothetical protein AVW11_04155 [Streptomyces amritsarensis]|uniref:Secreted protein n=1 Tax=Streptomyces amritsarensis TaxID=681158 RepID=A0ABX3G8W9_9ACTN|nr:hypothetical protein [Streptomyces amritsarensis]OLZ72592.1 hypothetical protein AVW11_04155 [Streptomyces amritsarensis]